MKDQLLQWEEKINNMSLRERVLMMLVGISVSALFLQLLLLDPVIKNRKTLGQQVAHTREQIRTQENEATILDAQIQAGVNREKIRRRDQLLDHKKTLNQKIETSVVAMIPPKLMPQVLEDILSQDNGLTLLSLEDRPVVPIVEQKKNKEKIKDDTASAHTINNKILTLPIKLNTNPLL